MNSSALGSDVVQAILDNLQNPVVVWTAEGRPIAFNRACCEFFGYNAVEMHALSRLELLHPDERESTKELVTRREQGDHSTMRFRRRCLTKDGQVLQVMSTASGLFQGGVWIGSMVEYADLTAYLAAQAERQQAEAMFTDLVQQSSDWIYTTDLNGYFVSANPAALSALEYSTEDVRSLRIFDVVLPEHHAALMQRLQRRQQGENLPADDLEVEVASQTGRRFWIRVSARTRVDPTTGQVIGSSGFARDVTAEREQRLQLNEALLTDPLTHLLNRRAFDEDLAQMAGGRRLATLLVIDLDNFKSVNDSLGHAAGDAALVEVARHLRGTFRPGDRVYRIGGDEFAVMLQGATRRDVAEHAPGSATFIWEGHTHEVGYSVGAATFPMDAGTPEALFERADAHLFEAKRKKSSTPRGVESA